MKRGIDSDGTRAAFGLAPDVESILESIGMPEFPYRETTADARAAQAAAALQAQLARDRGTVAPASHLTLAASRVQHSGFAHVRDESLPYAVAVISIAPEVGRTVIAANLAHAISALGRRCLALDLDPANALVPRSSAEHGPEAGILGLALDRAGPSPDLPVLGGVTWIKFGHGDRDAIERAEANVALDAGWLGNQLPALAPGNEFMIIDTPAGVSPWLEQALDVADEVLVVVTAGAETYAQLVAADRLLRTYFGNTAPQDAFGYALNRFDPRRAADRRIRAALGAVLGERLRAVIHADTALRQQLGRRRLVADTNPNSQVVTDLALAAERLIARGDAAHSYAESALYGGE